MSLIWDKGNSKVDDAIMSFTAGEDVILDREIFLFDIQASRAHVNGLARIDVLTGEECEAIQTELDALEDDFRAGDFVLDERFEDGHSAIEARLTERLGDAGKKVHTGRSRNDQVLVATRLYMREALGHFAGLARETAKACLERAEPTMMLAMPGYTHLQRAVPSSVGLWLAGFAEAFIDDALLADATGKWINANPLGTAAGYGVNVPLDRDGVAKELGFDRLQINPIYAQNSRGKFEIQVLDVLGQGLLDVRRLAWDLSLYTTAEFAFVELPDAYTTGSSIMPNKRNPDVVELLRGAYGVIEGARAELVATLSLPSGYHRDLQNTKPPLIRALKKSLEVMSLMPTLIREMTFNTERMTEAVSPDMFATDRAIELTASGVPFRDAYKQAAGEIDTFAERDAVESLQARTSPGGTVNPLLDRLWDRLNS